jgi:hypothetical protein
MHGGLLSCPITRNQESHDGALLFLQLFSWYQSRNISSRIFFSLDPPPMATSSDAATMLPLSLLPPVTEKLTRGNYSMWLAQVSANLQGAQLWDFTKPTSTPPPELLPATTTTDGKKSEPTAPTLSTRAGLPGTAKFVATSSRRSPRTSSPKLRRPPRRPKCGLPFRRSRRPNPGPGSWPPGWPSPRRPRDHPPQPSSSPR